MKGERMRVGIDGRKIPQARERGPLGTLGHARELGLDGVFFRTVLDISPELDGGLLAEVRAHATELGLYLEAGLGKVNPFASPETPELRRVGNGDIVAGFTAMMTACARIGCQELWVGTANYKAAYRGRLAYDRFRTDVSWAEQLGATARFLHKLAPVARDLGIHLNLETHEEITSFEVIRLVEDVGPDAAGIVFDTGNVLQRLEHPVWAARRVAPYTRQTHLKDAALLSEPGGVGYQMRPGGDGVVDFGVLVPLLLAANPGLNLSLETDEPRPAGRAALTMLIETGHPDFRPAHPDVSDDEVAAWEELVRSCEARVNRGELADHAAYGTAPYGYAEAAEYIRRSAEVIRTAAAPTPPPAPLPSEPLARRSA
jgi:sugar phosphate isomerase/epimerase